MSMINLFFVFFFGIIALKLNLSFAAECECDDTNPIIVNNTGFNFSKSVSNHSYCLNTSCSWTIDISQITQENIVSMTTSWNISIVEGPTAINDSISIFACDSGYVFLDSTTPKIPPFENSTSNISPFSIYTQEDSICINLTTGNGEYFLGFYVNVDFKYFDANLVTVKPITLNESMPLLMLNNDDLKDNKSKDYTRTLFQVDAAYGDLEFDVIGGFTHGSSFNNDGIFYIYESSKLTNYIDYYKYKYMENNNDMDQFKSYISKNQNLSVLFMASSALEDQQFYDRQMIFRIRDERTTNCVYNSPLQGAWGEGLNITNNIFYFDRNNWDYNLNISASPNGFCNFSILIPIGVVNIQTPFLGIYVLDYVGNTSVLVVKENNFPIFSINEHNFRFINTGVSSNLTTFVIPPNERLEFWVQFLFINYIPQLPFNKTIFNVFMLPNCQDFEQEWGIQQLAICVSCHAQFNITIVYIELYLNELLYISNGTYTMTFSNISLTNQTLTLYGVQLDIVFVANHSDMIDTIQNRVLVTYIGNALPVENPTKKEYFWIIGLAAGIMLILLIAIVLFIYILYKKKGKRFEQLFDLMKGIQLSTNELDNFKDKSDKMFIPNDKLFINYVNIIGQGSTSTIYKGHITGPSPLSVNIQLLETQKYSNCDVAVKVTRNFGSGEVELFYNEIQAMKTIGYHENVMCMLGWAMPGDTPCLVFDISQTDLLNYVKSFREMVEEIPYKNFLSILWQIARGMNFIASKALVHRDLAARNILLCNSNVAKISDFGLCCKCDEITSTYQENLKKRLPIKWLSIEALTDHLFSEKSDVWSFGILVYEVFTFGKIPYTTMNYDEVLNFLQEDKRLDRPENMAEEIYEICQRCWEERPENRPSFGEVEENFHEILERETESYGYLI